MSKKILAVLLCLAFIPLIFTGCGKQQLGSVVDLLKAGEYIDAYSLFVDSVLGSADNEIKCYDEIMKLAGSTYEDYNSGKVNDENANRVFNSILKSGILDLMIYNSEDFKEIYDNFTALSVSKAAYASAEKLFGNEDYANAFTKYSEVIEDDSNFEPAGEKLSVCIDKFAESIETQGRGESPDYQTILDKLYSITAKSDVINTLIEEYAIARATDLYKENKDSDFAESIAVIEEAIEHIGETKALKAELSKYNSSMPVKLIDKEFTKKGSYISISTNDAEIYQDLVGNKYKENNVFYPSGGTLRTEYASSEAEGTVTYDLDGMYSELQGTVYVPRIARNANWARKTSFKIYGDGKVIYDAGSFNSGTREPIDFDVDVTGVKELKIVILGIYSTTKNGVYTYHPKVCASNMVLYS